MNVTPVQLLLFDCLPVPADAAPWHAPRRQARIAEREPEQLALHFRLRDLERDDDTEFDYPRHAMLNAADLAPPETTAPRSIWDLAATAARLKQRGRFGDADGFKPPQHVVQRDGGVTRHVGNAYPSNRWTAEREEAEKARRARQKPPKPVKSAKTKGAKLREMIGEDDGA